jgi:hypothetical protein
VSVNSKNNQRVIDLLNNWAGEVINQGVQEAPKELGDSEEEVRRQGITLSQPILAANPALGHTVKQEGSLPSGEQRSGHTAKIAAETASLEDRIQGHPVHRIERLLKINLHNNGGSLCTRDNSRQG